MKKEISRDLDKTQLRRKQAEYDSLQKSNSDMTVWNTPPYYLRNKNGNPRTDKTTN